ncbi:DUF1338 domain-containing protein [Cupriavidus necator]|uniref:DUF1338 domain-containing protein n=1 Tax=Cupriavidus necator TaxID=106590 RepID=UPI0039C299A2
MSRNISDLVIAQIGTYKASNLLALIKSPASIPLGNDGFPSRAEIAHALNVALFQGILERVPSGREYTEDVARSGGQVNFDHGALRTVAWSHNGKLPPGEAAFTRFLRPLGYRLNGTYPLDRIGMTGRSYAHEDAPDEIAQFFVSEFHPEKYSAEFQEAVTNVVMTSRDPLEPRTVALLWKLDRDRYLPIAEAEQVIDNLVDCFERQHAIPRLADYERLLRESAEMAWIATEGNAFNHATDRVDDVETLSRQQKALGRPMKDKVEVSGSGRVIQTAFRADPVVRQFVCESGVHVRREVPGSFYEFITRRELEHEQGGKLDLSFDAGNAQAIFKMTAASA